MVDNVLCYITDASYSHSYPVRAGDLLRVRRLGISWKLEGKPFLVTGIVHIPQNDSGYEILPEELTGFIDGEQINLRLEDLEAFGND